MQLNEIFYKNSFNPSLKKDNVYRRVVEICRVYVLLISRKDVFSLEIVPISEIPIFSKFLRKKVLHRLTRFHRRYTLLFATKRLELQ